MKNVIAMNNIKSTTLLGALFLLIASCGAYAQSGSFDNANLPPNVIPPSPDAAGLGKYGNTPVGYHTGIPEINIPIYTIKSGSLELPISLSYHASGFRVTEISSWVGLGWSLNAGGIVSRSAVGLGDDSGQGYLVTSSQKKASEITTADYEYVLQAANGLHDTESDYYFYNFAGRSGKFVFDSNKDPFLIPQAPIIVAFGGTNFTITTEEGTIYNFSSQESMLAGTYTPQGENAHSYTSVYHLTQITSADGVDVINFTYNTNGVYRENYTDYHEVIGDKCVWSVVNNAPYTATSQHDFNTSFSFREITPLVLSEITFNTGKVEFIKGATRTDIPNMTGDVSRLSEIKVYAKGPSGTYIHRKSFTLDNNSYFNNGQAGKERLKLAGLSEHGAGSGSAKSHEFLYNEETTLPGYGSMAVDWWGYYNGQSNNETLVPTDQISFNGHDYTNVGNAIRDPNATTMKALILKKIVYPTGGFTEFDFEPHQFDGTEPIDLSAEASAGEMNNTTELLQETVSFTPASSGLARVRTHCSNVTDANDTFFSSVTVSDGSKSHLVHVYDPYNFPDYQPQLEKDYWIYLTQGVTYYLTVKAKGNSQSNYYNGAAYSKATVYWTEYQSGAAQTAGGLRVKEIRDYPATGLTPIVKVFKYGEQEDGKGLIITPANRLSSFKQDRLVNFWSQPLSFCSVTCSSTRRFIYGYTVHDLTTMSGSSVVYPKVVVYEKSEAAQNGRTEYHFTVQQDEFYPTPPEYKNGLIQVQRDWWSGDLIHSAMYTASDELVSEKYLTHGPLQYLQGTRTKIGWRVANTGNCGVTVSPNDIFNLFYYFDYPVYSGVKKLLSETQVSYSSNDPTKSIQWKTDYAYNNLATNHQQLSVKTETDSEGNTIETKFWYPADYGTVGNMTALRDKNVIAIPIKQEVHKNGEILSGKVSILNQYGKPTEIYTYETDIPQTPPSHDSMTPVPAGYNWKAEMIYNSTTKKMETVSRNLDVKSAYVWGYNNAYPIAQAVNAQAKDIFYTGFEDSQGNSADGDSKTGMKSKSGGFSKSLTSLTSGSYILSYWKKNASIWDYITTTVSVGSSYTISLTGQVDDVRFYPLAAQMTTYTYDPIYGISSVSDANSITTYYEYDDLGRLKVLKDDQKNIFKTYQYNYKSDQP